MCANKFYSIFSTCICSKYHRLPNCTMISGKPCIYTIFVPVVKHPLQEATPRISRRESVKGKSCGTVRTSKVVQIYGTILLLSPCWTRRNPFPWDAGKKRTISNGVVEAVGITSTDGQRETILRLRQSRRTPSGATSRDYTAALTRETILFLALIRDSVESCLSRSFDYSFPWLSSVTVRSRFFDNE